MCVYVCVGLYDIIQTVKRKFPAAGGFVNVTNFMYGTVNPQLWNITTTLIFVLCLVCVMKGKSLLPKIFPPGTNSRKKYNLCSFWKT